jgi:hypothetical protein
MSKAIIVTDFAYKGLKRQGRGTGHQGLRSTLKYFQYRDDYNKPFSQLPNQDRWIDHGLGPHYRAIFESCDRLQSKHVLAWTWVISPSPDLMALVPEAQRREMLISLTEEIVEQYYLARGFEIPEYAFVLHNRITQPDEQGEVFQHLHTHVVLPGTAPLPGTDRAAVYNNREKQHDALFREIGTQCFAKALDETIGLEWRRLREDPEPSMPKIPPDFDQWFAEL